MTERKRLERIEYCFNPTAPLMIHWHDHIGPIRVMTPQPVEGYVLARRPGAKPFVLAVRELLNRDPHPTHGPFVLGRALANTDPAP